MKTLARITVKVPALMWGTLFHERRPGVVFLIYHKLDGTLPLEIDIPFGTFSRQMHLLAQMGRVVSFDRAVEVLSAGERITEDLYVITFDDGYDDFYRLAFPMLRDMGIASTVFISTGFIETGRPDGYGIIPRDKVKPMSWDMLGEARDSGLVTLGIHTHSHPDFMGLPREKVIEEIEASDELFKSKLGIGADHFAYPRGLCDDVSDGIVRERYSSAVVGGGVKAVPGITDIFRIPRIPVRRSDGMAFFGPRVKGWLAPEERFYESIHSMRAAGGGKG